MKYIFPKAATSLIVPVFIQDSSSTTGAGLAGLDQTSGIIGGYLRPGGLGVVLAVDENVTTEGTYEAPSTSAHVRIGTPANMRPGVYELHFHNTLFATGANAILISLGGAANMADLLLEIQLSDVNLNDGVRGGMTALPNAAADGVGGLPISDAGGLDMDALASGIVTVDGIVDSILVDTAEIGIAGAGLTALASAANLAVVDGVVDSILVDTAEIGVAGAGLTALASAANLATVDGIVDSILLDTTEIGIAGAGLTALASAANLATVDGIVDSILLDTAEIGTAGAGLTALATAAALTTHDGKLDTVDGIVNSILLDTAEIGAAGAGLTTLATAANLAIVDTVVDTILTRVQGINAAVVTLQSPINQEGNLEMISGDSYSLVLTKTSYAGNVTASSPTATAHFAALDVDNYDDTDAVPNLAIACTFTATTEDDGSVTVVITVPITAAQTDSLAGRPPEDRFAYEYQVYLKDGAARATIQMGKLTVVSKVAPV